MKHGTVARFSLWFASFVTAGVFLLSGIGKLTVAAPHPANFAGWGYPLWLMFFVGALEVTGAMLLLVPRLATIGAAVLGSVMIAAIITHLVNAQWQALVLPFILLALLTLIGTLRAELLPLRSMRERRARART